MKQSGVLLLIIGVIWILVAFNMDTTVSTGGLTVYNIGRLDERRTHLILSSLLIIVGIILFAFGNREQSSDKLKKMQILEDTKKCPFCAETIKMEALICRFCHKDLPPDDLQKGGSIIDKEYENLSVKELYNKICFLHDGGEVDKAKADKLARYLIKKFPNTKEADWAVKMTLI